MKKVLSFILILLLLCSIPMAASAEEAPFEPTFTFTPPTKVFYTVGEPADYSGGLITYAADEVHQYRVPLSDSNCTGLTTSTPGIKTVTANFAQTAYFTVIVMSEDEPITTMSDIRKDQWFYEAFGITMKAGLFQGDAAGTLRPDAPITRAEFAALIYRAWGKDPRVMTADHPGKANSFTDVSSKDWFYKEVEACREAGILRGYEDGSVHPNENISRQDAVLMLMRIRYTDEQLAAVNIDQTIQQSGVNPADFADVSAYAAPAMALALGDLIQGDTDRRINPQKTITRAETATIYQRLFFGDYAWEAPQDPEPAPNPEEPAAPAPNPSEMPLIFLSPSSQFANSYKGVNTTEGIQMNQLAEILKVKLEAAGYRVYLPSSDTTYQERAALSNEVGADIHIPLHSNAGGGTGTRIFYNGSIQGSKELSASIFNYLGALTNTPLTNLNLKEDYLSLMPNGTPFHEIKVPKAEMAYIEVEFHDIAEKAQWIVNNKNAIADAIAKGIIDYCKQYLNK